MSITRNARRVGLVAGAIVSVGAVGYAAVRIVSGTDEAIKRVGKIETRLDQHDQELRGVARVEGKVDAMMVWFGVPRPSGGGALPPPVGPVVREVGPEVTP